MDEITYVDRKTQEKKTEKVYGQFFLKLFYAENFFSSLFLPLKARVPLFSKLYGTFQKSSLSRYKVRPFIKKFGIDVSEFLDPVDAYGSFNDFFVRRLRPEA